MSASTSWSYVQAGYDLDTVAADSSIPVDAWRYKTGYLLGSLIANAAWTPHRRVTLSLGLPFRLIRASSGWHDQAGNPADELHEATRVGIGEASLSARLRIVGTKGGAWVVDAQAGAWVPSGMSGDNPFAASDATAERHQIFGNGTVDPFGSVEVYYVAPIWRLSGQVWGRVPVVANDHDQMGSRQLGLNLAANRTIGSAAWRGMVGFGVQQASPAAWPGPRPPSASRTTWLGRLGVFWLQSPQWQWNFGVDLPFIQNAESGEFFMPVMLRIGVSRQVDL
ncbi:MAG: hypothetical protein KC502_16530 [Myxococcales bacterium]|nr:hypothetical protein [Myxococcales bacterium]